MPRVGVMHVIDTLSAAGAERVAVNIVNHLPREKYVPYLCTTRSDGPLDALVARDVVRLRLERKSRFDCEAVLRLRRFLSENDIRILHAHSSALFIARAAALGTGRSIIWHAHHGPYAWEDQRAYHYRIGTRGIGGAITVSEDLAEWSSRRLAMPKELTWYLPNPVCLDDANGTTPTLPGSRGKRIICVANFRPEKDHVTLVRAMKLVVQQVPSAHLLLVGKASSPDCKSRVESEISALGLRDSISILGERQDVSAVLSACDIGVLSSVSEGLPMSLLEYGAAGLAAVATEVGQCPDVLDYGRAGISVPPASADQLGAALISFLQSPETRQEFAERFHLRIVAKFSPEAVIEQVSQIYQQVLTGERAIAETERAAMPYQASSHREQPSEVVSAARRERFTQ